LLKDINNSIKGSLFYWGIYDWATSAYSTIILTFVFSSYFVNWVAPNKIDGVALWGSSLGIAGLFVALGGPILGAIADQSGLRKLWMAPFTALCIISVTLLWFVKPSSQYIPLGLSLVVIASISFEYSYIFYNAMLPDLAPPNKLGRWSGWGWMMGYAGGIACLFLCLLVTQTESLFFSKLIETEKIRSVFLLAACWIAIFSTPFFLFVPQTKMYSNLPLRILIVESIKKLFSTIIHLKMTRNMVQFLIARMIYNDALITLFAFGGIYASAMFQMSEQEVLLFGISLNVSAGVGAGIFAIFDDLFGSKKMIVISLIGLISTGMLAIFSMTEIEFWLAGLCMGIFVGPVQASSRSYLARIAPKEMRTQMFGFYALSGKATSFIGPLTVSWITYLTDSMRFGMVSIMIYFFIGLILSLSIKDDKS